MSSFVVLVILFAGMVMAAGGPRSFATPEDGAKALIAALRTDDRSALSNILGNDGWNSIHSGDETQYRKTVTAFLAAYDRHSDIAHRGLSIAVLNVGNDRWSLPIPLVKNVAGWHFETATVGHEILARRTGINETAAIQAAASRTTAGRTWTASPAK